MKWNTGRRVALPAGLFALVLSHAGWACSLAADAPPARYEGPCAGGLAQGRGIARSPEYTFEGDFHEGRRHGRGLLVVTGGHRYEGEFRHGKRHGQGITLLPGGGRHEGTWRDGEINGPGKLTDPKGYVYEGEFKDSRYHGRGVLTGPDGTRYDGHWVDGKRQGQGVQIYDNGAMASGDFEANRFVRGTHYSADRQTIRTFENGAIVHTAKAGAAAQAPAPSAPAPARSATQACQDAASSCETACAAGTLIGLLITQGKGDAEAARNQCLARCEATKSGCLARAQPAPQAPVAPPGAAAITVGAGDGRQYCPVKKQWCMYDRLSEEPPYKEFKRACTFYWGSYDRERGNILNILDTLDPPTLRRMIDEVVPPGAQNHQYFRDRAEVAKCLLDSGLQDFARVGSEHFRSQDFTFGARRLPRAMWDDIIRHTRALEARNHSTAWFEPGDDDSKEKRYNEVYRKCGPGLGIRAPGYFPQSWWEENLRSLEEIAKQGTASRQGEAPVVTALRTFRCHQSEGWPYAAENQLWVKYNINLRTR